MKNSELDIYLLNLQLFSEAGEKTEKPTSKRREQAREEGQVPKSIEINSAFLFVFMFLGLKILGKYMYDEILYLFQYVYINYINIEDLFIIKDMNTLNTTIIYSLFRIMTPILLISMVVALASNVIQVGWKITLKPLMPNFNKINPISGFKNIFSTKAWIELIKSIFKVLLIGAIVYGFIEKQVDNLQSLLNMTYGEILKYIGDTVVDMALQVGMYYVAIASVDYFYQRHQHEKSIMMTKEEIKQEYKQMEGDPLIKSKIKQKQREISMRRMMQDVPKADVIITNPTHYAVAVSYKEETGSAPIVVAKGQDYMALKIKSIAKDNKIHIYENKPLARALYSTTDIGQEIPSDLYQAVAEVLAFVYSLRNS